MGEIPDCDEEQWFEASQRRYKASPDVRANESKIVKTRNNKRRLTNVQFKLKLSPIGSNHKIRAIKWPNMERLIERRDTKVVRVKSKTARRNIEKRKKEVKPNIKCSLFPKLHPPSFVT